MQKTSLASEKSSSSSPSSAAAFLDPFFLLSGAGEPATDTEDCFFDAGVLLVRVERGVFERLSTLSPS